MGSIWWLIHSTASVKRATRLASWFTWHSITWRRKQFVISLLSRNIFRRQRHSGAESVFPSSEFHFVASQMKKRRNQISVQWSKGPKGAAVALVPITADWLTKANLEKTQTIIHVSTLSSGKLGAGDDEWCNVDTPDRWIFGACR